MRTKRNRLGWIAALALAALLLSACGGQQSSGQGGGQPAAGGQPGGQTAGQPRKGGVLKIANIGEPPTLDVHTSTATIVEHITQGVFESLYALDAKFQPQPMLAESHQWSADNKKLTVKLRQGILFHNDKEMTSDDVVASLNRWFKLAALGKQVQPKIESVKAPDTYTVEFNLKDTVGNLLNVLANPNNMPSIYPKEVVDKAGDKPTNEIIGTGPYKLVERQADRHIKLARWEKYKPRGEAPSGMAGKKEALLDEIWWLPVPEPGTRVAGLESGEYQFVVSAPHDDYQRIKGMRNADPLVVKPYGWTAAIFNKKPGKSVFADVKMREAFLAALTAEPLMKAAFGDPIFYRLDSSIVPKESPWFGEFGQGRYNKPDVAKVKQLLSQAGYDGKPIRWIVTKEYDYHYKPTVVAKEQLEAAGFKIDLQVLDWATVVQRRGNPDLYDVFTTAFIFAPEPTAQNVYLSATWPGWYESKRVADALSIFNRETDAAKRKAAWDEVQKAFWDELPVIKFGEFFQLHAKSKSLKGFVEGTPNIFFWNTWLEK